MDKELMIAPFRPCNSTSPANGSLNASGVLEGVKWIFGQQAMLSASLA
jgi:hypothetical protein